jgi:hypothetical protein
LSGTPLGAALGNQLDGAKRHMCIGHCHAQMIRHGDGSAISPYTDEGCGNVRSAIQAAAGWT